jgi:hypothetical protein
MARTFKWGLVFWNGVQVRNQRQEVILFCIGVVKRHKVSYITSATRNLQVFIHHKSGNQQYYHKVVE